MVQKHLYDFLTIPGKFQTIVIDNRNSNYNPQLLNPENKDVQFQGSVKLLRTEIDIHLKFEAYTSPFCEKASNQLNAICCIKSFLKDENIDIATSYILSNLSYCPLVQHFYKYKESNE